MAYALNESFLTARPLAPTWQPVEVVESPQGKEEGLLLGDVTGVYTTVPAFNECAVDALGDLLRAHGELLPLIHPERKYYAYNVTSIVDALDEEASEVMYGQSHDYFLMIHQHVFRPEALEGACIFRLPKMLRNAWPYVTEDFRQRVLDAELTGFKFHPVGTNQ
ncbi:MAG: hypothetical protein KF708_24875 [Pirellulales bacterium]|nr:hypothetical protein [Pirellulales bacterium]